LHPREINAARCISQCYTPALGMHVQYCERGDYEHLQYHACRHRSCPKCGEHSRQAWIDVQLARLLPCAHFHVIFTLPHSLLQLWEHNRRWFIGALFDCARGSLLKLTADPKHLGATPGLMMSLHTWGRDLSRHPHLHCLVTAGGVDEQGQWKSTPPGQLVPYGALHNLFRGKMLAQLRGALGARRLVLPAWLSESDCAGQMRSLYAKRWNVRVEPQYEHGAGLTLYLARYAKGGPLPQGRALRMQDGQVLLQYTDHRDKKHKTLRLSTPKFIERVLWHAPPRGVHTTRHAGLYSTPYREQHALAVQELNCSVQTIKWPRPPSQPRVTTQASSSICPQCGWPLQRLLLKRPALRRSFPARRAEREISILSRPTPAFATGPPGAMSERATN
jgi:Putative transposase/Transposase zinc-binding domain